MSRLVTCPVLNKQAVSRVQEQNILRSKNETNPRAARLSLIGSKMRHVGTRLRERRPMDVTLWRRSESARSRKAGATLAPGSPESACHDSKHQAVTDRIRAVLNDSRSKEIGPASTKPAIVPRDPSDSPLTSGFAVAEFGTNCAPNPCGRNRRKSLRRKKSTPQWARTTNLRFRRLEDPFRRLDDAHKNPGFPGVFAFTRLRLGVARMQKTRICGGISGGECDRVSFRFRRELCATLLGAAMSLHPLGAELVENDHL